MLFDTRLPDLRLVAFVLFFWVFVVPILVNLTAASLVAFLRPRKATWDATRIGAGCGILGGILISGLVVGAVGTDLRSPDFPNYLVGGYLAVLVVDMGLSALLVRRFARRR